MKTPVVNSVSDELWAVIAPLLPPERPKPKGGRPRMPDRAALAGILFVLKGGICWETLPYERMTWAAAAG
jgi:transposase